MKRIFAILMTATLLMLTFSLVACDEDESDASGSTSSEFEYNGGVDFDPNDGTFGVDFGDLFGSGYELPDDVFE